MSDFDPSVPAVLHEQVTNRMVPWAGTEEERQSFDHFAIWLSDGSVEWQGHLFDGWGNVLGG
jgi:hypothetical protein